MKRFAVQHYTFRPLSNEIGFFPMLDKVAAMGYNEMESCFFGGFSSAKMSAEKGLLCGAVSGILFFTVAWISGAFFETIGFVDFEANSYYHERTSFDSIGVAIASKKV